MNIEQKFFSQSSFPKNKFFVIMKSNKSLSFLTNVFIQINLSYKFNANVKPFNIKHFYLKNL